MHLHTMCGRKFPSISYSFYKNQLSERAMNNADHLATTYSPASSLEETSPEGTVLQFALATAFPFR